MHCQFHVIEYENKCTSIRNIQRTFQIDPNDWSIELWYCSIFFLLENRKKKNTSASNFSASKSTVLSKNTLGGIISVANWWIYPSAEAFYSLYHDAWIWNAMWILISTSRTCLIDLLILYVNGNIIQLFCLLRRSKCVRTEKSTAFRWFSR